MARMRQVSDNNKKRLADQIRTIINSSDLEIQEMHQKTNNEQDTQTIRDTPTIDKHKV